MWSSEPLSSVVPASGSGDSAAYTNFVARTTGLDTTHLAAYKALLDGLTADGLFNSDGTSSYLDVLYIFATQDTTTASLSLINAANNITLVNGPIFTPDLGYAGNGSTASGATFFNPATAGGAYAQNSAHISVWNLSNISDLSPAISAASSQSPHIYPKYTADSTFYARLNESASPGFGVIADPRGLLLGSRTASNLTTGYRNAVSLGTVPDASAAIPSNNISLFGDGSLNFSTYQLAAATIGGGLTGAQVTNLYNRLRAYMTTIGVP